MRNIKSVKLSATIFIPIKDTPYTQLYTFICLLHIVCTFMVYFLGLIENNCINLVNLWWLHFLTFFGTFRTFFVAILTFCLSHFCHVLHAFCRVSGTFCLFPETIWRLSVAFCQLFQSKWHFCRRPPRNGGCTYNTQFPTHAVLFWLYFLGSRS